MSFSGERLKKARIYRNRTISELSEAINVTKQAISQYEKGVITPKPETLFQIVNELNFPLAFFMVDVEDNNKIDNTFFRALSSAKTLDLDTQRVKTEIVFSFYEFLCKYLTLPLLDIPNKKNDNHSPEEVAERLRAYWNLGNIPITNMVSLLEKKGIIVSAIDTGTQNIDAFTQIQEINNQKSYCVILGNDKQSMVRRNFDSAHELGHIMLHNDYPEVSELSKDEFKIMEQEANQFAAAFLLPRDSFYLDLNNPTNLDSYIELKKKWRVSIAAMIVRAKQIGRINTLQYQNLMKQLSYKKWRKSEPFDDVWKVAKPQLFKQAIDILIENEILSPSEIVSEFGRHSHYMNSKTLEDLIDLEEGKLNDSKAQDQETLVVSIKREK